MRARLPIILLVSLLVIGGAYYALWRAQADRLLAGTQRTFETINATPPAEGVKVALHYDTLAVDGFPFKHNLHFGNLTARLDFTTGAVKRAFQTYRTEKAPVPPAPGDDTPVMLQAQYPSVDWSTHYFTTHTGIAYSGGGRFDFSTGNETLSGTVKGGNGACDLGLDKGSYPFFFGLLVKGRAVDWKETLRHVDRLECTNEASEFVALDTGEWLSRMAASEVRFTNLRLNPELVRFTLKGGTPGYEVADRFQRFAKSIFSGSLPSATQLTPLEQYANTGSTRLDMDLDVDIGRNPNAPEALPEPMHIDVRTFSTVNKLMQIDFPFYLDMKKENGQINLTVRHDGKLTYSPVFDQASVDALTMNLTDPATREMLTGSLGEKAVAALTASAGEVMPKWSSFGPIHTQIDLTASGSAPGNTAAAAPANIGGISLKRLRFAAVPYSFGLSGSYDSVTHEGFGAIDSEHYARLVSDIVDYANRVQTVLHRVDPAWGNFMLSPELKTGIVEFLASLNTSKQPDALSIAVKASGDGQITISGQPMATVMMNAIGKLQPLLPQPGAR